MRKKIVSLLMGLVLIVGLLPMSAAAVSESEEEVIRAAVTEAVTNYAKQLYRANSDDDAFWNFVNHGFFGNGKSLYLTENDAIVSALFNSKLGRLAFIDGITTGLVTSQRQRGETLYFEGGPSWHQYDSTYYWFGYLGESNEATSFIGSLAYDKSKKLSTMGAMNANDDVMKLLVGGLEGKIYFRKVETKQDSALYHVELVLADHFDFKNADYDYQKGQGFDTSTDEKMVKLGLMLNYMGLNDFYWEFKKSFEIRVPTGCSHSEEAFHWSYDGKNRSVVCDDTDGFTRNNAAIQTYVNSNGDEGAYMEIVDTVVLRHDAPWVMEYTLTGDGLRLSSDDGDYTSLPVLYQAGRSYAWIYDHAFYRIPEKETEAIAAPMGFTLEYTGLKIADEFSYDAKHRYLCRMENVISSDGSNMIYYTIIDETAGEVVYGPEIMNDMWTMDDWESIRILQSEESNHISGKDILINYIGNRGYALGQSKFDLKIWENGKDGSGATRFADAEKAPTCTEQGATVHTCRDCGYSYMTDVVPALGHSYGGYVYNNDAKCTADGTQSRKCTVCGETETIAAPDTATGHAYKAVVTAPTYTEQGYTTYTCTVCGDSYKDDYTDVKQHSYVPVITAPTCTEQGYTTYTCTECGDTYKDNYTDLAEHTPVIDPAVAATCVEKGKTEGSHCGVCGLVLKKQAAISVVNTHRMEESIVKMPTYEEAGQVAYICKDCGRTDYMDIPPLTKPERTNPFTDVSESDWFYDPVLWAVENNVTGGKTATTFAPNDGCTRAQVVTFLWAANGKPEPKSMNNPFVDVPSNAWYLKPVLWAVEQGITGGVSADRFAPEQTCTRAQIATFLWAAMGKPAAMSGSEFIDVTAGDWYAAPIIWAKEQGITGGIGNGMFGPNNTCTRAQVVTFLNKVYG